MVRLGGVDVVVVGVDPGRAKPLGLPVLEQAETGADLDVGVLVLDRPDHVGDAVDVAVGRAAAAGDHAHPGGAAAQPRLGLGERLVLPEPGVAQDLARRAQGL